MHAHSHFGFTAFRTLRQLSLESQKITGQLNATARWHLTPRLASQNSKPLVGVLTTCFLFPESQLQRAIQDLFIAGTESIGTTLKWSILFMAIHTETQRQIQQEIGKHQRVS